MDVVCCHLAGSQPQGNSGAAVFKVLCKPSRWKPSHRDKETSRDRSRRGSGFWFGPARRVHLSPSAVPKAADAGRETHEPTCESPRSTALHHCSPDSNLSSTTVPHMGTRLPLLVSRRLTPQFQARCPGKQSGLLTASIHQPRLSTAPISAMSGASEDAIVKALEDYTT